ncbi:MAG: hypothetical protein ACHQ7N_08350 [Candidatus Methylomirabilales bacterium]
MIVRLLQDGDVLGPPHWPMGTFQPCKDTTLVAVEAGKIVGLCWGAYGGQACLDVIWLSGEPRAARALGVEVFRLAERLGCATVVGHVEEGSRFLDVLSRRGWAVNQAWTSRAVMMPVDKTLAALMRQGTQGGAE